MSFAGGSESANFDINVQTGGINQAAEEAAAGLGHISEAARKAASATDAAAKALGAGASRMGSAGKKAGAAFSEGVNASVKAGTRNFEALSKTLEALARTSAARIAQFQKSGLDPNLTALFHNEEQRVLSLQHEIEDNRAAIIASPKVANAYKQQALNARKTLTQEGSQLLAIQRQNSAELANTTAASTAKIAAQGAEQRSVALTQEAGKRRVAITRAALDTIGRLEKGLGRTIEGVAKTSVGAVSKIFSGLVGTVQRSFSERRSIIRSNLNSETRLFQEQNVRIERLQATANRGLIGGLSRNTIGFLGGGFALIGAVRHVFEVGSQFALGLNVLQAQLGLTADQMKTVSDLSIKLGNDVKLPGVSALDAAQAIQIMAKQFSALGSQALPAAEAAAKGALELSRAVGVTAESAGQAVGASVNVFGVAAAKATDVADILASALAKSAGISFEDFKNSFVQAAPIFASFEKPVEGARGALVDFSTALAVLAKGGLFGETAGAGLKTFLIQGTKLTKGGTIAMAELSKRAGITGTAFFTADHKARPFGETINILEKGLVGLNQQQRNAALGAIFGNRSITIANVLLGTSIGQYLKLQQAIGNSTDAAAKFAAAQNKGIKGALDAISSVIDTIAIQLFQKVNVGLGNFGLTIANFVNNVLTAGGAFAVVRKGLLGVAAGLGAILAVKTGVEVLSLLAKTLPLLLTPFGALSVVAAGLGAAFFIASNKSKSFSDTLNRIKTSALRFLADAEIRIVEFAKAVKEGFDTKVRPILSRFGDLVKRNVQPGIDRIKELGQTVVRFLQPAISVLSDFGSFLRSAVQFALSGDFATALKEVRFGAEGLAKNLLSGLKAAFAKIPFGEIASALSSNLGRALAGIAVGGTIGGLIAGPLGAVIGAGLAAAIGLALPRIRSAIAGIDWPGLFSKLLDGVHEVGRRIGVILSDKRTILAVAGIAAAAAALAVQFVTGFVQGILSNLGDIRAAGATMLRALFDAPSIAKSVLAFVILFRRTLFGALPLFQSDAKKVGTQVARAIGTGATEGTAQAGLVGRLRATGAKIGAGLGESIAIGLSAALSGSALGTAKTGLEKGLGIAGVAGSAAAAFSVGNLFGGPAVGTAAAAASLAISGVSAVLGANAQKAKEAKDRMLEFRDALTQSGGVATVFQSRLSGASDKVVAGLLKAKVNIKDFQDALAAGKGQEFVDSLKAANVNGTGLGRTLDVQVVPAVQFLQQAVNDLNAASKSQALRTSLDAAASAGRNAVIAIAPLKAHVEDLGIGFKRINDEAKRKELQGQIDALTTKTNNAATAARNARTQFELLLAPKPETAKTATQQGTIDLPSLAAGVDQAISDGVKSALGAAETATSITGLQNDIRTALSKATTKEQFQGVFKDFSIAIGEAKISPAAKLTFIKAAQELQNDPTVKAALGKLLEANTQDTQAAASKVASDFLKTFAARTGEAPPIDVSNKIQAAKTPQQAQAIITAFTRQAEIVAAGQHIDTPPMKADTGQARTAGVELANAVARGAASVSFDNTGALLASSLAQGIRSGIPVAVAAGVHLAAAVKTGFQVNTKIKSPSKVFIQFGQDITDGLVQGLKLGTSDATSAAKSLADAVVNAALTVQQRLHQALASGKAALFDAVFGGFDVAARTAVDDAKAGFTSGLNGIAGALDSAASSLFSALGKKANERSLAERLLVGESAFSLNLGDELGVGNRAAIQAAVKSIEDIGVALLQQGQSATTVAKTLGVYRAQLLGFTSVLGFNKAQVEGLLNSLGLSTTQIAKFVQQAATLTGVINEAGGIAGRPAAPVRPAPLPVGRNPVQSFIFGEGAIQINTDHDPQATALTIVNRIALGIH